ncbi:MAG: hypothetical protein ACK4NY_04145 [Spirosomataceae bacterium]
MDQLAILALIVLSGIGYAWIKVKQKAMNDPLKGFQPKKVK